MLSKVSRIQGRKSRDSASYGSDWSNLSKSIRETNNWICSKCNKNFAYAKNQLHSHHLIPLSRGGLNSRSNLVALCVSCHREEHNH